MLKVEVIACGDQPHSIFNRAVPDQMVIETLKGISSVCLEPDSPCSFDSPENFAFIHRADSTSRTTSVGRDQAIQYIPVHTKCLLQPTHTDGGQTAATLQGSSIMVNDELVCSKQETMLSSWDTRTADKTCSTHPNGFPLRRLPQPQRCQPPATSHPGVCHPVRWDFVHVSPPPSGLGLVWLPTLLGSGSGLHLACCVPRFAHRRLPLALNKAPKNFPKRSVVQPLGVTALFFDTLKGNLKPKNLEKSQGHFSNFCDYAKCIGQWGQTHKNPCAPKQRGYRSWLILGSRESPLV